MNSIIPFTKPQLAAMDTEKLINVIYASFNMAMIESKEAEKEYLTSKGEAKRAALVRLEEANKKIEDYIEEQRAMFASKGLDREMVWKNAIVPTGETTANGSEVFRIVTRKNAINLGDVFENEITKSDMDELNRNPEYESDDDWEQIDNTIEEARKEY